MAVPKFSDAVVCIDRMLEWLRAVRNTLNVCECDCGARDGEGRYAKVRSIGERWIAAIIHDIEAADSMMVIIMCQEFIEIAALVFNGET